MKLSFAYVSALSLIAISCGKDRSTKDAIQPVPATTPPPGQTEKQGKYRDVKHSLTQEYLETRYFPSQLNPTAHVDACKEGQSFYLDKCWDELHINVDEATVSLKSGPDTPTVVMALDRPISEQLEKTMEFSGKSQLHLPNDQRTKNYISRGDAFDKTCQGHNFVLKNSTSNDPHSGIYSERQWKNFSPSFPDTPSKAITPWVISSCLNFSNLQRDTETMAGEKLLSFGVKTTFAYGLRDRTPKETIDHHVMTFAHNYHLNGQVIIQGKTFQLPMRAKDLEKLTFEVRGPDKYVLTNNGVAVLNMSKELLDARKERLLTPSKDFDDVVSDIQFSVDFN